MNKKLYVITPIFNPFNFKSRYRLYRNFARQMAESGVELFTVEAAFGDQEFVVTTVGNPMNLQLRTNQILWHKERMINLARKHLEHVVPSAQFLGWFDADITFANPDWVSETVHKLSHLPVVQPFSEAINLNAHEEYMWHCPSSFRSFIEGRGFHQTPPLPVSYTYKGHPGLACCARRDALDALGGLFDTCVAGSGDTVMCNALKGDWSAYLPTEPSESMRGSMRAWAARADRHIRGQLGFTRGALLHHWHGRSEERGYEKRWDILAYHQFDPLTDLCVDDSGLYRWAGNKPRLQDDIRLSLSSRNEDAT